jgi:hypothetical protein
MKLKLSQIIESQEALSRLSSEKLPIKIAYNLQRNIRLLKPEIESYEKTRIELIKTKYGTEQKDGSYQVIPERTDKFIAELNELLSVDVDLDVRAIKMSEFTKEIASFDLLVLDWMFINDLEQPL